MNAARIKTFIETFCCQKNGQPIKVLDWQYDKFLLPVYDNVNQAGERNVRQVFCFLPRRNGKSSFIACLLIFHCLCDEPGQEIFIISNTVTQSADACFDAACAIVEHSPQLSKRLEIVKSRGRIVYAKNRSKIQVLSSDKSSLLGKNASILAFDEIAFFKDRRLYANLRGSQLNRKEPLLLSITTASDNLEGIGKELFDYAVGVRDGTIDDATFYPLLYQGDEATWDQPNTWMKANPSCGHLFQLADLEKLYNEAKHEPRKESEFKQFHLNLWQHSSVCWLSKDSFDQCQEPFTEEFLHGRKCYAGIDLARTVSDAAYCLVFPIGDDFYLLPRYFIPEAYAKRKEEINHAPYQTWSRQKHLTTTPGDYIDYAFIKKALLEDAKNFQIVELGFDPWQANELWKELQDEGVNVVEVKQTLPCMSPATMFFESLVKERRIKSNHPILAWNVGNAAVRTDVQNNIMVAKKDKGGLVDGLICAIIGLSRAMADTGPDVDSWCKNFSL